MTVLEEFNTHLRQCPGCVAVLDGDGEIVPARLCRHAERMQQTLEWSSARISAAADRLLTRLTGTEPAR